jgi:drug/metabolite transporter (DMT)-like permease
MQNVRPAVPRRGFGFSSRLLESELLPVLAILSAVFLWGASFPAMRVSVRALSPWAVMEARMLTGLIILLPMAGRLLPRNYRKGDWKFLLAMVLFQPCLYFLLESNALRFTTSSQAGVIASFVPLLVAVGAWLVLSEVITRTVIAGLSLSIGGVAALTLLQAPGGMAENPLLGNLLEVGAMVCAAANIIAVKGLCRRYGPWSLTALQVVAGSFFFAPGLWFMADAAPGTWSPRLILILLFLGSFVTIGAFGLYNWGMSRIPASRASAFINLVPVAAVLLGWILLGEGLTPWQCAAALAVIAGVSLGQWPARRVAVGTTAGACRTGADEAV